jgi:pimeloyl-ACP methyl ester carboxylesterase
MLDLDGPVHLVDHGGDGPPMLLVHGLGGSHLDWMDVAPALARDHHVWAVDLIGFGRTPRADREATVANNQRLVDGVVERIGGGAPAVLVGNSMGGLISIVEAARRPDHVKELILVDPAVRGGRGGRVSLMITLAFLVLALPRVGHTIVNLRARRLGAEKLVDSVLALCTVDRHRINPETREAHIELTEWRQNLEDPYQAFVEASRSLVGWLREDGPLPRYIEKVAAPTLLVHGDRDQVVSPRAARAVAAQRPDWTFRMLEDTGHIPQMERPDVFLDVVTGWLRTERSTAGAGREAVARAR